MKCVKCSTSIKCGDRYKMVITGELQQGGTPLRPYLVQKNTKAICYCERCSR